MRCLFALVSDTSNAHLLVGELAPIDDDVIVERDRAVTHRYIVVPLRGALATALRIGPRREQEIPRKTTRPSMMTAGIGTIESDRVPASLRIKPPAEMGDDMTVHVLRMRAIAVEPRVHELGVETAPDTADEAVTNLEADLVLHVAAIGQDDNVARLEYDRAI